MPWKSLKINDAVKICRTCLGGEEKFLHNIDGPTMEQHFILQFLFEHAMCQR